MDNLNCDEHGHQIAALALSVKVISDHQAEMQVWITENSEVTREVRDLLAAFKVSLYVANWITKIAGAWAIIYAWSKGWLSK